MGKISNFIERIKEKKMFSSLMEVINTKTKYIFLMDELLFVKSKNNESFINEGVNAILREIKECGDDKEELRENLNILLKFTISYWEAERINNKDLQEIDKGIHS